MSYCIPKQTVNGNYTQTTHEQNPDVQTRFTRSSQQEHHRAGIHFSHVVNICCVLTIVGYGDGDRGWAAKDGNVWVGQREVERLSSLIDIVVDDGDGHALTRSLELKL